MYAEYNSHSRLLIGKATMERKEKSWLGHDDMVVLDGSMCWGRRRTKGKEARTRGRVRWVKGRG
jgi:hypothetical protein